nr:MAG TPA: hypothetical protein [Caudoviricetes sp.]
MTWFGLDTCFLYSYICVIAVEGWSLGWRRNDGYVAVSYA